MISILNALIIDDEEGAIETLCGMLTEFCPTINIVGTAISVAKALELTEIHKPDLVFLDIEISPMGGGFDYMKLIKNANFQVIFTTAYPQYAIKAINTVRPVAYLIKPYSVSDLVDAIERATEQKLNIADTKPEAPAVEHGIIVSGGKKGNIALRYSEIVYCKADKMLTEIFVHREGKVIKIMSFDNIGEIEKMLTQNCYMRIHNSYIVNFSFLISFDIAGKVRALQIQSGEIIPVSAALAQEFKARFKVFWNGK